MEGVIGVNKPQGISSAQVLRELQHRFNNSKFFAGTIKAEYDRILEAHKQSGNKTRGKLSLAKQLKMGHGGTLDPLATGVLIVGIGSGTKELQNFLGCTKTYETTVLFGAATDSYDIMGKVVATKPYDHVAKEGVLEAIQRLRAKKMQKPPIFSALRHEGKRFYEYAREGKQLPIEIPERPAEIHDIEVLEWLEPGSHPHKIPDIQAEEEILSFAKQELGASTPTSDATARQQRDAPSSDLKRKHEDTIDAIVQQGPDAKKHQSEETMMSGALGSHSKADQGEAAAAELPGPPACRIRLTVSTGFYVRSFVHDLGREVDSLALMATLVRTRQEKFELGKNVLSWEDIDQADEAEWAPLLESLFEAWRERQISDPVKKAQPRHEVKSSSGKASSKKQRPRNDKDFSKARGGKKSRGDAHSQGRERRNTSSEGE